MSQNTTSEKILLKFQEGKSKFYNVGLNGEPFEMFPNLTAATTAEEETQMIENAVDEYCVECGNISDENFRQVVRLIYKIFIGSYREGLLARAKDHLTEKESA